MSEYLSELQAIFVGSERQESAKLFHNMEFTSPTGCFIYLGIWIPVKIKLKITHFCFNKTLRLLHLTSKRYANIWSSKVLSLIGKITIINSSILPQFIYKVADILSIIPKQFLKQFKNVLYKFIWGFNWKRIARKTLYSILKPSSLHCILL